MKAIVVEQTGAADVLKLKEMPDPSPGPDDAVVKLHAAGVNFIDIYHRRGDSPKPLPFIPGLEAAGVVESLGKNVSGVKVGDRVAYTDVPGSYAEKSVVPADKLIIIPEAMPFEEAAAVPLQGMTAHYLVNEFYKTQPGDTVLVHAAAGGMGLLLVQWLKHLGGKVIGTVSSESKAKLARDAGAAEVIDYSKSDWVAEVEKLTKGKGVRFIIDGVGKTTFPGDLKAVCLRGDVVVYGSASGRAEPISPNDLQMRSITVSGGSLFNYLLTREELTHRANDVLQAIKEGWLKLNIGAVVPLSDACKAHEMLEGRQSTGKIVLRI
jgi:NADPH:quinone reductase